MTAVASGFWMLAFASGLPTAGASGDDEWGINGTYIATSNGQWAQTNDIYRNEASVRSTWTISMTCSTPLECTGRVSVISGGARTWASTAASTS